MKFFDYFRPTQNRHNCTQSTLKYSKLPFHAKQSNSSIQVLLPTFLRKKSRRGQGRVALVALRRARNILLAFLFAKLFLCACGIKEKAAREFVHFYGGVHLVCRRRKKRKAPKASADSLERESDPPIRTLVRIEEVCTARVETLLCFSGVCADLRLCTHPQTSGGFSTRRRRRKRKAPKARADSSERESEPPIRTKVRIEEVCTARV